MLAAERRQAILERLRADGKVVAAELSVALDVSPDTIRRDLKELTDGGLRVLAIPGGQLVTYVIAAGVFGVAAAAVPARRAAKLDVLQAIGYE